MGKCFSSLWVSWAVVFVQTCCKSSYLSSKLAQKTKLECWICTYIRTHHWIIAFLGRTYTRKSNWMDYRCLCDMHTCNFMVYYLCSMELCQLDCRGWRARIAEIWVVGDAFCLLAIVGVKRFRYLWKCISFAAFSKCCATLLCECTVHGVITRWSWLKLIVISSSNDIIAVASAFSVNNRSLLQLHLYLSGCFEYSAYLYEHWFW